MNPLFIVVGMPGAGKSTVVKYLAQKNWPIIYFGNITLEELKKRGLSVTPENEKLIRESLRKIHGIDVYAQLSLDHITQSLQETPTIIDGLYSWDEYKLVISKINNPVYMIAVCSNRQGRYQRLAKRTIRPLSLQDAEKRDYAEIENIQKGGPIAFADFTILNNDSKSDLKIVVDNVLLKITNLGTGGNK